jgi:type I restriction enzyme M protein
MIWGAHASRVLFPASSPGKLHPLAKPHFQSLRRGREDACAPQYQDIPGFCKSATTAEIAAHGHLLTPGRYVGAEGVADDGDPFAEKIPRLVGELHAQFAESAKLKIAIKANLKGLGYAL